MASKSPAEVLFSAYHRRVLALLLLHPDQSFYVREISRLADVPAGSLHRELKLLAESGLLHREPAGNLVRYRANQDASVFPELASFFRKTVGLADILRDALAPFSSDLDLAFVFGSVAQGKERASSDVDVFVIGSVSFTSVVQAFAAVHERLGREVNPVVMPRKDFVKMRATHDRFITRVMEEPKLFLIGTENDLGKLVKDRTAKKSRR